MKQYSNTQTNTVLKYHQLNFLVEGLNGIMKKYPEQFLTVTNQHTELTITIRTCDFFRIGYDGDELKILLKEDLPQHIKDECQVIFNQTFRKVN